MYITFKSFKPDELKAGVITVIFVFEALRIVADTPSIVTVKSEDYSNGKFYPDITSSDPP